MNRFVSQKMRLIPIPLEGGARTHRHAHQPKELYPNRLRLGADLFLETLSLLRSTNHDTKAANRYIWREFHLVWESSWNPHVPDDRRHLCETIFASQAGSPGVFGSGLDLGVDWQHNAELHGRRRQAELRLKCAPPLHAPLFHRLRNRTVLDYHDAIVL
jgi:hypothetical protein